MAKKKKKRLGKGFEGAPLNGDSRSPIELNLEADPVLPFESHEVDEANRVFDAMVSGYLALRARRDAAKPGELSAEEFAKLEKEITTSEATITGAGYRIEDFVSIAPDGTIGSPAVSLESKSTASSLVSNPEVISKPEPETVSDAVLKPFEGVELQKKWEEFEVFLRKSGRSDDANKMKKLLAALRKRDFPENAPEREALRRYRREFDPGFVHDETERKRVDEERVDEEDKRVRATLDVTKAAEVKKNDLAESPGAIAVDSTQTRHADKPVQETRVDTRQPFIPANEWRPRLLQQVAELEREHPEEARVLQNAIDNQDIVNWPPNGRLIIRPIGEDDYANVAIEQVIRDAEQRIFDRETLRLAEEKRRAERDAEITEGYKKNGISPQDFSVRLDAHADEMALHWPAAAKRLKRMAEEIRVTSSAGKNFFDPETLPDAERKVFYSAQRKISDDLLAERFAAFEEAQRAEQEQALQNLPPLTMAEIQEQLGGGRDIIAFNPETGEVESGFVLVSVEVGNGIQIARLEKDGKMVVPPRPLDEVLEANALPQKRLREIDDVALGTISTAGWGASPRDAELIQDFFTNHRSFSELTPEAREIIRRVYDDAYHANPSSFPQPASPPPGPYALVKYQAPQEGSGELVSTGRVIYDAEPFEETALVARGEPTESQEKKFTEEDAWEAFQRGVRNNPGEGPERGRFQRVRDLLYNTRESTARLAITAVARMKFGIVGATSFWDLGKYLYEKHKVHGKKGLADAETQAIMALRAQRAERSARRMAFDESPEGEEYRRLRMLWLGNLREDGTYEGGNMSAADQTRFEELLSERVKPNQQRADFYKEYGPEYKALRAKRLNGSMTRPEQERYTELTMMRSQTIAALEGVYTKLAYVRGGQDKGSLERRLIARQLFEYSRQSNATEKSIRERSEFLTDRFIETNKNIIDVAKGAVNTGILAYSLSHGMPWLASARVVSSGGFDTLRNRKDFTRKNKLRQLLSSEKAFVAPSEGGLTEGVGVVGMPLESLRKEVWALKPDQKVGFFRTGINGARKTWAEAWAKNPESDRTIRVKRWRAIGTIGTYLATGAGGPIVRGMGELGQHLGFGETKKQVDTLLHGMSEHFKPRPEQFQGTPRTTSFSFMGEKGKIGISDGDRMALASAKRTMEIARKAGNDLLHGKLSDAFREFVPTESELHGIDPFGTVEPELAHVTPDSFKGSSETAAIDAALKQRFHTQWERIEKGLGKEGAAKVLQVNSARTLKTFLQNQLRFGNQNTLTLGGFTTEQLAHLNWDQGLDFTYGHNGALQMPDAETLAQYSNSNSAVKAFFEAHQNIPVTSHTVDAVFSGHGEDLAKLAKERVETPTLTLEIFGSARAVNLKAPTLVEVATRSRDLHADIAKVLGGDESDVQFLFKKLHATTDEQFLGSLQKFLAERPPVEAATAVQEAIRSMNRMTDESALRGLREHLEGVSRSISVKDGKLFVSEPVGNATLNTLSEEGEIDVDAVNVHELPDGSKHLDVVTESVQEAPLGSSNFREELEKALSGAKRVGAAQLSKMSDDFFRRFPGEQVKKDLTDWYHEVSVGRLVPGGKIDVQDPILGHIVGSMDQNGVIHETTAVGPVTIRPPTPAMMQHPYVKQMLLELKEQAK
jgi:hypothetical protein